MTGSSRARFTMRPSATSATCRDVVAALWEYLDGALDNGRAARLRAHIRACASCRARHNEAQALLRTVARTQGMTKAPDALRERIDALLRAQGLLP